MEKLLFNVHIYFIYKFYKIIFVGDAPEEIPFKQIKLNNDIIIEESSAMEEIVGKNEVVGNSLQSTDTVPKISKIKQPITVKRNSNVTINKKQPYTSQLLQKLLSRSIQHERNLICQCVKYIVDNNFFD